MVVQIITKIPKQNHFTRAATGQPPEFRMVHPQFHATHDQDSNKKIAILCNKICIEFRKALSLRKIERYENTKRKAI